MRPANGRNMIAPTALFYGLRAVGVDQWWALILGMVPPAGLEDEHAKNTKPTGLPSSSGLSPVTPVIASATEALVFMTAPRAIAAATFGEAAVSWAINAPGTPRSVVLASFV